MNADRPDEAAGVTRPIPVRPSGPGDAAPREPPQSARDSVAEHRPTPVRDSLEVADSSSASSADPDVESVLLQVDGVEWRVVVQGRSNAGVGSVRTPLLLLGFFEPQDAEEATREALVVGRCLSNMTECQLESTFRKAAPPRRRGSRPFFPEATSRGRRGDG